MPYLDQIKNLQDLKALSPKELPVLCDEIRHFLIETVTQTGGHLGASLGTVELTVALHYLLNSPKDKIVWDVSHQAYTHKILTGRRNRMTTLRHKNGLSGFTDPQESEHDFFKVGHASTAISQAFGLAVARDFAGGDEKIVAIVGDGSLTGGLAYEALNNAGHTKRDLLIILNDNEMSIAKNVGALSKYLNSIITNPLYNRVRKRVEQATSPMPRLQKLINRAEESFKNLIVPGFLFEELGFRYFGPLDGHDVLLLKQNLKNVLGLKGPRILHVMTKKGKGCELAEQDPERLHGISKTESKKVEINSSSPRATRVYTSVFSDALMRLASKDRRIVAITAAMPSGTGLDLFQQTFPERFFDVGIAEEHAITFAGALAKGGMKPVCAIYSTFIQRAVDQLLHDVALQEQGVILALDRAGVVGEDGPTHHGLFDIALLRSIPGAVLASPKDSVEMERMLELGLKANGVFAIRYPRGKVPREFSESSKNFEVGEGEVLREGDDLTFVTLGPLVASACEAAERLELQGISAGIINMRFAKPLDRKLLQAAASGSRFLVTLEDHVLTGGFGSGVLEALSEMGLEGTRLLRLGFDDKFIPQATREELLEEAGLTPDKITLRILKETHLCKK